MLLLKTVLILFVYVLGSVGVGAFAGRFFVTDRLQIRKVFLLASSFLLGQGILASLWILLALYGYLKVSAIWAVLFTFMSYAIWRIRSDVPDIGNTIRAQVSGFWSDSWMWKIIILSGCVISAGGASMITKSLGGDAATQNFVVGKVVAATGYLNLNTLPGLYHLRLQMGLVGEMHFAALMGLGSPEAAKLIEWPNALAGALLLVGICRNIGLNRHAQWIAWLCFFTSGCVAILMNSGKVDLIAICLALAGYFWATCSANKTSVGLVGIFCGFACVAKLSLIVSLVPAIAFLLVWRRLGSRPLFFNLLKDSGVAIVWFIVATIPHFFKSVFLFGDPLITFTSKEMSVVYNMTVLSDEVATRILSLYLISIALMPTNQNLSILVIAFLPLIFVVARNGEFWRNSVVAVFIAGVLGQFTWLALKPTVLVWRYLFPSFLMMTPLAAQAAAHCLDSEKSPCWLKGGIFLVTIVTTLAWALKVNDFTGTFEYLVKKEHQECRGPDFTPYCSSMNKINAEAAPGDRVLLLSEILYWLRPDLIQCISRTEETGITLSTIKLIYKDLNPNERWTKIVQNGFKYIFVDRTGQSVFLSLDINNLPPWISLTKVYEEGETAVYRIETRRGVSQLKACQEKQPNAWALVSSK